MSEFENLRRYFSEVFDISKVLSKHYFIIFGSCRVPKLLHNMQNSDETDVDLSMQV